MIEVIELFLPMQLPGRFAFRIPRDFGDQTVAQVHDPVGHEGNVRIMRDDGRGGAQFPVHALERLEHGDPGLGIERARRLVAEQDRRVLRDRPRYGDPLLLPPESCDGKWSSRSPSPTRVKASSGFIGSFAISVTTATFSRAVRLGIRL